MPVMTDRLWRYLSAYSLEVFGEQDEILQTLQDEAAAEGLPDIAVGPDVGRLLMVLTSMTLGRLAVEVGTLGGYSGIWIARGLAPNGRLITIDFEPRHAGFAARHFERAGLGGRAEIRVGAALDVLARLREELPPRSVDVLFLDARKAEYGEYFTLARPLIASGGLVLADNVYGTGHGWIDEGHGTDAFNRLIAADPEFEAVALPIREGILVGRRSG